MRFVRGVSFFLMGLFYCTFAVGKYNFLNDLETVSAQGSFASYFEAYKEGSAYFRGLGGNKVPVSFTKNELNQIESFDFDAFSEGIHEDVVFDFKNYLSALVAYAGKGDARKVFSLFEAVRLFFEENEVALKTQNNILSSMFVTSFSVLNEDLLHSLYDDFVSHFALWQNSDLAVIYFLNLSYYLDEPYFLDWAFSNALNTPYAVLIARNYLGFHFYEHYEVRASLDFLNANMNSFPSVSLPLFLNYLDVLKTPYQRSRKVVGEKSLESLLELALELRAQEPKVLVYLAEVYEYLGHERLLFNALVLMLEDENFSDLSYFLIANLFERRGDTQSAVAYYDQVNKEPYLYRAREKKLVFSKTQANNIAKKIKTFTGLYPQVPKDRLLLIEALMMRAVHHNYVALSMLEKISLMGQNSPFISFLKSQIYLDLGEIKQATSYARKAVNTSRTAGQSRRISHHLAYENQLASCLLSAFKVTKEAEKIVEFLEKSGARNPEYLSTLAWFKFLKKDVKGAIALLEHSMRYAYNERQETLVSVRLAEVLAFSNQKNKADLVLDQIHVKYPKNPNVLSAIKKIAFNF